MDKDDKMITLDTSMEKVIDWDRNGDRLVFDTTPGRFKALSAEELDQLSSWTKNLYHVMKGQADSEQRAAEAPSTPGLEISGRFISPGQKLAVNYPEPFLKEWHPAWLRCDEHRGNIGKGYTTVTDEDVETATPNVGGGTTKLVGDSVYKEYELMKLPLKEYERRRDETAAISTQRVKSVEKSAIDQMRRAGGKEFVPPEGGTDGRNWGPPAED